MDFKVGQTFVDTYPPEAAEWCNGNRAYIIEVEKDGEHRQFQIVAYPELSLKELKEEKPGLTRKRPPPSSPGLTMPWTG